MSIPCRNTFQVGAYEPLKLSVICHPPRLCHQAPIRLALNIATLSPAQTRHVLIKGRPAIAYDALSIDIGIVPRQNDIPGSLEHTTPVKPING